MKGAIFWRSNAKYFSSDYETFTLSSALLNSQHPEGEVPPSALLVFFFDQHCIVKLHHLLQCSATSDSYKPPLDPLQLNLSDPNSLLLLGPLPPRAIPLPSACPTSSTSHSSKWVLCSPVSKSLQMCNCNNAFSPLCSQRVLTNGYGGNYFQLLTEK